MLDSKGVTLYWKEQAMRGDNPCHYHNKWQDRYAFLVRTRAFKKGDFMGAAAIVDLGCGIGEYTEEIVKLTNGHIDGFDFPFNIEIAIRERGNHPQISFHPTPIPSDAAHDAIMKADVAYTTTVYVHFSPEARAAFYTYVKGMRRGARIMLLEYIPEAVPEFQKGLPYKEIETVAQIEKKFQEVGCILVEKRHVNFIDSFFFFHLGRNIFSFLLTIVFERLLSLVGCSHSKYKMLIFEKQL